MTTREEAQDEYSEYCYHMMKFTLTDLRLTREWVQQQSSNTVFAAESIAIIMALDRYRHMEHV